MKIKNIQTFLFDKDTGFLIKFHLKKGLDLNQLDEIYEMLETLKMDWKYKDNLPKQVLFYIFPIISELRRDLQLYSDNEVLYYQYEEKIDALDKAISMCLNPNINDEHYNKPLKDLGSL